MTTSERAKQSVRTGDRVTITLLLTSALTVPCLSWGDAHVIPEGGEYHLVDGELGTRVDITYSNPPGKETTVINNYTVPGQSVFIAPLISPLREDLEYTIKYKGGEIGTLYIDNSNVTRYSSQVSLTIEKALINAVSIQSSGSIDVDTDSHIKIMNSDGHTTELTNHGVIDNISMLYGDVLNTDSGSIGDIHLYGILTNKENGTVKLRDDTSFVRGLWNESKISDVGVNTALKLNGSGNVLYNSGVIELSYNGLIVAGGGTWSAVNTGDIRQKGPTGDMWRNAALTLTSKTNQINTLNNEGVIIGEYNAITIDKNPDELAAGGLINITNAGKIFGDISTEKRGTGLTTVLTNEKTGLWIGAFMDTYMDNDIKSSNTFASITNHGTIRAIRDNRGGDSIIHSASFFNDGTIDIRTAPLTIDGDYIGMAGSKIWTSGVLGGDETQLPNLVITGTVSGDDVTLVKVDNLGGAGAATTDGILVVRASTVEAGGFEKEGRIVAGAYDYDLVRVESGDHTEWRLTSALTPEPPGPPVPPGPEPGPEPVPPVPPVPPAPVHVVRPEAVTYAENLRQANTLFMTDSEQRRAVGEYSDPVTGRTETSSLWLSQTGGHSARHDASGQLNSDYNRYTVQLGGTLLSLPAGDDGRLEAGVQAGYGHARGNTRSGLTGYRARGTVSGYSTGLYGTWRQHRDGQSGAYISTTLQYSWLKNQVKGDDLAAEKYDARGTTLSLEGGYDYAVWQGGEQNGDSLFIRPHAQVTRMGVKADEHREVNGTRVSQQGDGSVFSRTGVRVWLDKAVSKGQRVQPFVETNWLHNTRDFCSSMDGVRDCLAGNRNQAEVLAGVTGDVSRNVAVTAQAGGRFGSQASRDLAGTLNVSVKF